ncbi:MAG TPA: LamG-like jellyroll fold domain-containing protein [Ignavibacteria bacterium]|nr:LamG-like jellyroll fold domain-containing protein [Ignavibacteria bacterium]
MKLAVTLLGILSVFIFVNLSEAQYYYNRAFSLPGGAGNYVAADPGANLSITGSFTLECWVRPTNISSPANQILFQKRLGSGQTGYGIYAATGGRPAVRTNQTTRLTAPDSIKNNVWNHVAATYDASTGTFVIYLNGVQSATVTVANATPAADTDSLRIGAGFNAVYAGLMDEIRIWNVVRTQSEIVQTMRIPLGVTGGLYPGLVVVYRANTVTGGSGIEPINGYTAHLRGGCTFADIGSNPGSPMAFNTAIIGDATDGSYIAIPNSSATSPTTAMTLEAWVYHNNASTQVIFAKGSTNYPYRMVKSIGNSFRVFINGTAAGSGNFGGIIPNNKWTHLAFTYDGGTSTFAYYMNGIQTLTGTQAFTIPTNSDSVTIAGGTNLVEFNGLIDEVRIANYVKTPLQIAKGMFVSIDSNNEPNPAGSNLAFNFDGTLQSYADTITGSAVFVGAGKRFTNVNNPVEPPTPLNRFDAANFADGFSMRYADLSFGAAPTSATDSVFFPNSSVISDINVFVGVEHAFGNDVSVSLKNPSGNTTVVLYPGSAIDAGMNMITIFDDQADSSITATTRAPFSPKVKPSNPLSAFNGQNTSGWWKLTVTDINPGANDGRLAGWGIQFNNQTLVGVENNYTGVADKFSLSQNYPNPFNPSTTIRYSLAKDVNVKILLFDILGREIQTLTNEFQRAGSYELLFNAKSLASGTYFYKILAGDFVETKKMLLIK